MTYPLLEHDDWGEAKIEPGRVIARRDVPEVCVLCFFREVIERVVAEQPARVAVANRWEDGPHPLYELDYAGQRVAFAHPGVGAALSAALLEEVIAFGCRTFVVVGGAGVLQKDVAVGNLMLVSAALRDEGVSYHYLPPARWVEADAQVVQRLAEVLSRRKLPFCTVKTWTTDAPYRETPAMIAARRAEGCVTVEMEASGLLAVAQFRKVKLGQILYAGDDLSGEEWDRRGWQSRSEVRNQLFWLAVEAGLAL